MGGIGAAGVVSGRGNGSSDAVTVGGIGASNTVFGGAL